MFDISFKKFASPSIVKIVYVLAMAGIVLGYLSFTVGAFQAHVAMGLFTMFLLGPVLGLLYLCFIRVVLESVMATIMTAQNTAELVRLQQGPHAGPPQPGAQGTPPGPGPVGPQFPGPGMAAHPQQAQEHRPH